MISQNQCSFKLIIIIIKTLNKKIKKLKHYLYNYCSKNNLKNSYKHITNSFLSGVSFSTFNLENSQKKKKKNLLMLVSESIKGYDPWCSLRGWTWESGFKRTKKSKADHLNQFKKKTNKWKLMHNSSSLLSLHRRNELDGLPFGF